LDHAHQTHLGYAPAHDVERLHQPAEPIALNLERGAHGFGFGSAAQVGRRGGLGLRFRTALASATFAGRCLCARRGSIRGFFRGRGLDRGGLCTGRSLARICTGRSLARSRFFRDNRRRRGSLRRRGGNLRVLGPVGLLGLCRPLQQNSGKLGDGLHGLRPSLRVNQGRFISQMQRLS
jgi:hypothetical protein